MTTESPALFIDTEMLLMRAAPTDHSSSCATSSTMAS